ncbi:MAG: formate--phosphoribosylaminoimidazolecarboxamide ligase family protein [Nitrososphaerales archaeon]
MITRQQISEVVARYDPEGITIGTLGSHSALDICRGAKDEHLQTLAVCQKGREETYDRYYRVRKSFGRICGVIDKTIVLDKFQDILNEDVQSRLVSMNTVFVPHRSFTVYVPYDGIEGRFLVPIFGSRSLLRAEERDVERNQHYLLEKAEIRTPHLFRDYTEIDRLVVVKVGEAERTYERAFFYASSPKEFEERSSELINKGMITREALSTAVIEEFTVGAQYNFNFFYSPLLGELELLGTDARRQTNLDGLLRLPADEQLKVLEYIKARNIEVGHFATTIRESLLEKVFKLGERFVEATKEEYPPGIIGPFALQGAVLPGPPKEDIVIFDVSLRVPGSPGTKFTHYTECYWGLPVSTGRRIAMEVKAAVEEDRLEEVVT